MNFLTVEEFKNITKCDEIKFIMNTDTDKLFVSTGDKAYKAQQGINNSKPIKFMYSDEEGFDKGCFTNVESKINVMFTLQVGITFSINL